MDALMQRLIATANRLPKTEQDELIEHVQSAVKTADKTKDAHELNLRVYQAWSSRQVDYVVQNYPVAMEYGDDYAKAVFQKAFALAKEAKLFDDLWTPLKQCKSDAWTELVVSKSNERFDRSHYHWTKQDELPEWEAAQKRMEATKRRITAELLIFTVNQAIEIKRRRDIIAAL